MPIFSFKCKKCNKEEDRLVKRSDIDTQKCSTCGELMLKEDKIMSTTFNLKGNWFKTTKSY